MAQGKDQTSERVSETQVALEDARLQIGDQVQLQPLGGDEQVRYAVRLIGQSRGRSVLVTTPIVDNKYLLMREGQSFVLRAFSGKSAIAFSTRIIKSVNTPYPYLHLAYPKWVRSLVIRKGARAAVKLVCAIRRCAEVPIEQAGTIVNISIGGALMVTKHSFDQKGQRLLVKFKVLVNGIEAILELNAVIRAINVDASGETDAPYNVGLQFVDVTPEDSIPLLAYVYYELLQQTGSG